MRNLKQFPGGKIATQNKTGAMVTNISDISKQFIHDACQFSCDKIVVDIGCCYGVATIPILEQGRCHVIGIDLSQDHLDILQRSLNSARQSRFTGLAGKFPYTFNLDAYTVSAIHAAHLLQFLTGDEIEAGLNACYTALLPQGKLYISTTSIYLPWVKNFLPIYHTRSKTKKWPGEINNFTDYAPEQAKEFIQDFFHILTKEQLVNAIEKIGFSVEHAFYYDTDNPTSHAKHGKEMIGIIACKK